ncbi:MAG: cytidine deaminase [Clostridiales bacterium]|nr:cytidine deaminase [Clostridiales bacterium]
MTFLEMQDIAKSLYNERYISPFMQVAGVSAVIETANGNIYTGVNIDTDCGMGFCAERNAAGNMITNGESKIIKLLCYKDGELILPCGVCREFLMQIDEDNKDLEICLNAKTNKTIKLKDLMPSWWGYDKYKNGKPTKIYR